MGGPIQFEIAEARAATQKELGNANDSAPRPRTQSSISDLLLTKRAALALRCCIATQTTNSTGTQKPKKRTSWSHVTSSGHHCTRHYTRKMMVKKKKKKKKVSQSEATGHTIRGGPRGVGSSSLPNLEVILSSSNTQKSQNRNRFDASMFCA